MRCGPHPHSSPRAPFSRWNRFLYKAGGSTAAQSRPQEGNKEDRQRSSELLSGKLGTTRNGETWFPGKRKMVSEPASPSPSGHLSSRSPPLGVPFLAGMRSTRRLHSPCAAPSSPVPLFHSLRQPPCLLPSPSFLLRLSPWKSAFPCEINFSRHCGGDGRRPLGSETTGVSGSVRKGSQPAQSQGDLSTTALGARNPAAWPGVRELQCPGQASPTGRSPGPSVCWLCVFPAAGAPVPLSAEPP